MLIFLVLISVFFESNLISTNQFIKMIALITYIISIVTEQVEILINFL